MRNSFREVANFHGAGWIPAVPGGHGIGMIEDPPGRWFSVRHSPRARAAGSRAAASGARYLARTVGMFSVVAIKKGYFGRANLKILKKLYAIFHGSSQISLGYYGIL